MVSVVVVVRWVGRWERIAFEQATKRPVKRCEHQQDPLIMSMLSSRAVVQGYDEDRRKGRCCCCFGGGCRGEHGGDWNAKGKEQLL